MPTTRWPASSPFCYGYSKGMANPILCHLVFAVHSLEFPALCFLRCSFFCWECSLLLLPSHGCTFFLKTHLKCCSLHASFFTHHLVVAILLFSKLLPMDRILTEACAVPYVGIANLQSVFFPRTGPVKYNLGLTSISFSPTVSNTH